MDSDQNQNQILSDKCAAECRRFAYRQSKAEDLLDEIRSRNGAENSFNAVPLLLHVRLFVELKENKQTNKHQTNFSSVHSSVSFYSQHCD